MDPDSKRQFQLLIGFAIFAFAVVVSYFSVVEADTEDTPQYDIYLVLMFQAVWVHVWMEIILRVVIAWGLQMTVP